MIIEALARSLEDELDSEPPILLGYSTGGTLAHALAEHCEREGVPVAGVILLDTHVAASESIRRETLANVLGLMADRQHELIALDDDNLLAMAAYLRVMDEWAPATIEAPSLLIQASEPLGGAANTEPLPAWQTSAETVVSSGDHFSMIEDGVDGVAEAIENWLARRTARVS